MVVLKPQSEYGHAPPPQTPYSIVTNIPGWDKLQKVRDGDMSPMGGVVHIYPRFSPTHFAAQLGQEIAKKTGEEGKGVMVYFNPIMIQYTRRHVSLKYRREHVMKPEDLTIKVVDVAGHRVYAVMYNPAQTFGIMESWGQPGLGLSIRAAEELLKGVATMTEVPFELDNVPAPTFTPESWAHEGLRARIHKLIHRGAIDPSKVTCQPKDVFLYPTGMAAVYHTTNLLLQQRPGTAVVLGVVFHNTHHHLHEESPNGFKHFGKVDKEDIDGMESWLEEEKSAGRPVSFAIVEFPGNPTLDSVDLHRLKKLSEKHGFILIVDDTIGSFANVDVFAQADILLTSLTKSFSGYSNVLGGSVVLNPQSSHYATLATRFKSTHKNELFAADAEVLLTNSVDFLTRARRLNCNAEAMASFFQRYVADPNSPVTKVQYPTLLPTKQNYDAVMRRSTPEFPEPGYGCLFTVEFENTDMAKAFFDNCGFYSSPHLGAHVTLMLAYNMLVYGRSVEDRTYFREIGVKEEGIRFSAGLEDREDLIDTIKYALDCAAEAKKNSVKDVSKSS
ncbi:pyridoxal phosphate-dependent transferase [Xylogone sp. PMI_703]|nr:pyridoxal phosphate-dependent transferase [Xylogone sp. PMI_703]